MFAFLYGNPVSTFKIIMIYLVNQVSCYSIATMETFDVAKCCAEISPLFPWDQLDIHPKQFGGLLFLSYFSE